MKFPSLQKLQQAIAQVLQRFPLEIFCAATGTAVALWLLETERLDDERVRLLLCAVLGLVLFLSATVFSESKGLSKPQLAMLRVAVVLALALCWFSLAPIENETSVMRYALYFIAFHLLVSFAPKTALDNFWEYNKQLFLRILLAALYSGVLFVGVCIAIASANFLFSLQVDEKIYARVFIIIAGLFNTLFFLAGIPTDFSVTQSYPKGLKIFTQYVLVPLATIYLAIILAYEIKVIVQWTLPSGVISWLILGYAVYGILSILLVYPVRHQEENRWISTYSKWFYVLLVPLLPLLCVAIGVRVLDYGITEPRYIVLILALWLTGVTGYFLFTRQYNIKVIPMSLCLVALLSAWGPQSASSVSERSQIARLNDMFGKQGLLTDGQLQPVSISLPDSAGTEMLAQVRFVLDHYGPAGMQPLLPNALFDSLQVADTIKSKHHRQTKQFEIVREYLALKPYYVTSARRDFFEVAAKADSVALQDYDFLTPVAVNGHVTDTTAHAYIKNDTLYWRQANLSFNLSPLLQREERYADSTGIYQHTDRPQQTLVVAAPAAMLVIQRITFQRDSLARKVVFLNGFVLLKETERN